MLNIIPITGGASIATAEHARRIRACWDFIGTFPQQRTFTSFSDAQHYAHCVSLLTPADVPYVLIIKVLIVTLFIGTVLGAWIGYVTYKKDRSCLHSVWEQCGTYGGLGFVITCLIDMSIAALWFVFFG